MGTNKTVILHALDKMADDVVVWRETADVLAGAKLDARELALTASDFSYLAPQPGNAESTTEVYGELQNKLVGLLSDGSAATNEIADALEAVIRRYARTEEDLRADIGRILDQIEGLS